MHWRELIMSKELGKFLEELRGKMSLREAAEKSGLSHTYIRDLELGENRKTKAPIRPSADTLIQLAKAYKHSSNDLLKRAGYIDDESIRKADIDPLLEIKNYLSKKGEAVDQFGFFNIDEWNDLTPEEVEEVLEDFEIMFNKAKRRKKKEI
jgi:transcriptional regulator with XRE-family HTH domain